MRAVVKRELYSLYTTPQGYVFTGAFVLVMNIFFYFSNIVERHSDLGAAFTFMLTVLMFTVPVLTMRMFSEEYRRGTDRLIFTAPVKLSDIALGKFFACLAAFAVSLSVTLIWAEILALFGALNLKEYLGHMTAIITFAAVYISIGLLVSALTESQTVSMLSTLGAFAALLLLDIGASMLPDSAPARFMNSFSLFRRYDTFSRGVFSVADLLFAASCCVFFLFLTTAALRRRRSGFKGVKWLAAALPALAAVIAANLLCGALESTLYLKYDMTRARLFALSAQTELLLRELPEEVTITVLCRPEELSGIVYDESTYTAYQLSDVREYLNKYAASANPNLTFQYVDPYLNPAWARSRDIEDRVGLYSIVVESGRRCIVLSVRDLFETQTVYDYDGSPVYDAVVGLNAERVLTSALLNVITEVLPAAAVVTGHGEYELEYFNEILSRNNFNVERINLGADEISANTSLLVIASPMYDFTERELTALDRYLSGGGNAVFALDPAQPPLPAFDLYIGEWGARFERAYVCDADFNYGSPDLLLPAIELNRFTETLNPRGRYPLIAGAGVITTLWNSDGNRAITPILSTYDTSYAKRLDTGEYVTDLTESEGDLEGPFIIGAVSGRASYDGGENIIAFLPLSMLADEALALSNFLNRQFLTHLLSQTRQELIIDIPPRDITTVPLALNSREASALLILLIFAIPIGVFGGGVFTWYRRRKL